MSGFLGDKVSGRRGLRRQLREERERQRRLTLRHRWYAGGIATLLSGALIFTGVGPAIADTTTPTPTPTSTDEATPPDETTPEESTPEESKPEESTPAPSPTESTPAPSPTETTPPASRLLAPDDQAITQDDPLVTPLATGGGNGTPPALGNSEIRFTITKGGDRTGPTAVAPLSGATFGAFEATSLTNVTNATAIASCTTDATGTCWITVPARGTGTGQSNLGYVVRETTAPTTPGLGYRIINTLAYSFGGLTVGGTTPYSFYSGAVGPDLSNANSTFALPSSTLPSLMGTGQNDDINARTTSGTWANARINPTIPAQCGLNVALLADLSTSVQQAGAQQNVRDAAAGLVSALTGTPSQVAIYTFGTNSPAPSAGNTIPGFSPALVNDNVGLQSVASTSAAAFMLAKAQNLTANGIGTQYTNWDGGLWALQPLASNLDAVIVLTDGMPTKYGPNATATGGANTRFIEMENAIASANAIRAAGAKIITFGVGNGASGAAFNNLAAISGPNANSDYYQTSWEEVAAAIKALADANCQGTVNVTKQVLPIGGTFPQDATAQSGWTFTATAPAATVREDVVGSSYSNQVIGQTGATGVLGLRSLFSGTTAADRLLSITETPGAQYSLRTWSEAEGAHTTGDNARCVTTAAPNTPLDITNIGNTGFTIAPQQDATISCTVVNQAVDQTAQLRVDKIWRIDTNGDGAYEQTTAPNVAPTLIPGLAADLILSGNAGIPSTGPWNFGQLYGNLTLNSTVNISETIRNLPPLCTNSASYAPTLGAGGLFTLSQPSSQGTNVVTITNTVTCESRLTLVKEVTGGATPATDWTLDAIAPNGALAGPNGTSGSAGATAAVSAETVYPLREIADTPAAQNYTQQWLPTLEDQWEANHAAGATGSWVCVQATSVVNGEPVFAANQYDGRNGGVEVGIGGWSKCTAINDPKPTLQLVKQVSLNGVLTTVPVGTGSWTLSADWSALTSAESGGADGITPSPTTQSPDPVTGLAGFPVTNVAPGHYTLTETGSATGYTNGTSYSCSINGGAATIVNVGSSIMLETGDAAVCTIVNTRLTGTLSIVKAIDNPQAVAAGKVFSGTYTCNDSSPQSTGTWSVTGAGAATLTPTTGSLQIPSGTTCTVAESPNPPSGGLVDASWVWGSATISQAPAVVAGQSVTATVTNHATRVYGSIAVTKNIVNTPAGYSGTFTGTWSCTYPLNAADNKSGTWSIVFTLGTASATTYTGTPTQIPLTSLCSVAENTGGSLPTFPDPSYTWASSVVSPSTPTAVSSSTAPVTFTVTNTAQRSSLQLSKIVQNPNGGLAVSTDWNQKLQATPSAGSALLFNHQETKFVAPGTYTLAEINQLAGYSQTNLTCSVGTLNGNVVTVAAGQAAACVFTNTDIAPTLTLVKKVDNKNGVGSAFADDWTLSATPDDDTAPSISGKGSPADTLEASISGPVKGQVEYTLGENGPSGYQAGTWSCFITGTQTPFDMESATSVVPEVGTNVTCEITNTAIPADGTIKKDVVGAPVQNPDGSWTIVYDIVVTNNSSTSTYFYTVTDQLLFGAGITPTGASWTGKTSGTFTDPLTGVQTLDPAGSLAPSGTATYRVTVVASIANGTQNGNTWQCSTATPTPAAGGFLNSATLKVTGKDDVTVYDCEPPAFPTISKTGTNPATQNADASWNVSYTVTITNPSGTIPLQAALTDALPSAPAGWTLVGGAWTVTAVSGAPINAAPPGGWTPGTKTIWNGTLPVSTSYSYTVSGVLLPSTSATPIGDCAAGGGFKNKATVTSGNIVRDAEGCVTIVLPPVTVVKSNAGVVVQTSLTTWQIDYTVSVTNSSTTATVYTLADTPSPGAGWTVDPASNWVPVSTPGQPSVPAANTPIAGSTTHTYQYRMVVTRDAAVQNPSLTCDLVTGGGFFNRATVTFPGTPGTATDTGCATPGTPTVTKDGKPAIANPDGTWTISYDVVVGNTSGKTLFYSLTDTPPAAPANTTLTNWAVTGPGASATWPTPNTIASASIANGATHTFTISATLTFTGPVTPVANACGEGTGTGIAVVNTATVTNNVGTSSDDGCTSVNPPTVTIVKADAAVSQNADFEWVLTYLVTVENTSATTSANYTITDAPQFGTNFDIVAGSQFWSAGNTPGATTGQTTNPTGTLLPNGTAQWTYHVKATVDDDDFDPETGLRCTTTGQTPGGGFFNVATVTFPGGSNSDPGCGVPASPKVVKTAQAVTQNGANWVISYEVEVSNNSGISLAYALTDVPQPLPTDVVAATDWSVTGPVKSPADAGTAALNDAWDPEADDPDYLVAMGTLPAGATHTYTVTREVTLPVDADFDTDVLLCGNEPGDDGFWNTAIVGNGVGDSDSSDCAEVVPPTVTIEKSDAEILQNGDFEWELSYEVTVTNESDEFDAQYSLTDTPEFGSNFDIVAGSGAWTLNGSAADPTNQTLPAGESVTWVYSVKATQNVEDWDPETGLVCTTDAEVPGGGFYNVAEVVFPGGSDSDDGCGEPASPTVVKDAPALAAQNVDGNWVLTYTVTVSNDSDLQLAYDLGDTPDSLPTGVNLVGAWGITGPAAANGGSFIAATPAWDGDANTAVGTGILAPHTSHVFTVTGIVTLTSAAASDDLTCSEEPGGDGFWNSATVTNGVGDSDDSACTSVTPPTLIIEKSDGTVAQLANGSWQIDYTITVTNATFTSTTYTLTDLPVPGAGWTWSAADSSWRNPADTSQAAPAPAANTPIAAAVDTPVVHTYVYRVIATRNTAVQTPSLDCVPGQGGAFYNTSTIVFPGGTATANGCAEPGSPNVAKAVTPGTPTFDEATGLWTLSYDITVSNVSGIQLAYTLTDDAAALPDGMTGGTWAIAGPTIAGGTAADSGTANGSWAGSGQAATGVISNGATHTYTATRVVSVAAGADVDDLTCGETPQDGGGVWNHVTVTNGVIDDDDDACIDIERPTVTVLKTVTSTTQGPDGGWTVTYDVTVTNDSDEQAAQYDLTDELLFGEGIVPVTTGDDRPSWTGPTTGQFAEGATSATLATGEVVAAGGVDTYTITVHATISADAWQSDDSVLTCGEQGSLEAGGFLNAATVTANDETSTSDDCSEPKLPTVDKTGVSAAQDPDDSDKWLVSYTVTVTGSGYPSFYTLKDNPSYPAGVTVSDGKAQRTGDATVYEIGSGDVFPYDSEGDPLPVAIGGAEVQTWTVTWIATIPGDIDPVLGECGQTPQPQHGFYNQVQLLQGGEVVDEGDTCIPVDEKVYPTIEKTVTSTAQDAETGLWTITYEVVAKLAGVGPENPKGLASKYSLTDELQFGGDIDIESATWRGPAPLTAEHDFADDGTAVIATDRPILAGGVHTYTVTVVADVLEAAIDEGTTACYPDSEDPSGGFLNTATLTSGEQVKEADDCSEPVLPEVEKTGTGSTQNSDGSWNLTYSVKVSYPNTMAETLPSPVGFTLTDAPVLPAGVSLKSGTSWTATAVDGGPVDDASWVPADGTWTIVDAGELVVDPESETLPSYTYTIAATVVVTAPPSTPITRCDDTSQTGIVVVNNATLTSGNHEDSDSGCDVVHYDDMKLVKTSQLPGEQTSVEPGDEFTYVLTVTNLGTRPATGVKVTDLDFNRRLEIGAITVSNGHAFSGGKVDIPSSDPALDKYGIDIALLDSVPVGETFTVEVDVTFLPANVEDEDEVIPPGREAPTPSIPLEKLDNRACVAADRDAVADNNCDVETIPTRDITGVLYATCQNDAPLLAWVVMKSSLLLGQDISMVWTPDSGDDATDPPDVTRSQSDDVDPSEAVWAHVIRWPGTVFTPSGISIDYPGWRPIQAADIVPGSDPVNYFLPGTATPMSDEQRGDFIFNGLILDPSELDFAWRGDSTVKFSVNPELTFQTSYPDATPEGCQVARHTEVQIEKTASVEKTEPGKSFTYTMDVKNVSDDSAAADVIVTDAIPADLKVTNVTWADRDDDLMFPTWKSCDVTGKDSAGYGGTLTCELFGPLMPVDFPTGGRSVAPQIILSVTVNPASKASVITNVGVVDYHTFGDPEDTGRDMDDATVLVSALPVTGGSPAWPLVMLSFLALLGGATLLIVLRRKKGEPEARL